MSLTRDKLGYVKLRAPKTSGEALQLPSLKRAVDVWSGNGRLLSEASFKVADLAEWQVSARQQVVSAALDYTRAYRDVDERVAQGDGLIVSGHQPTLFHPGVWYKNFALDALSRRLGAVPINLVIDNDVCSSVGIRVPTDVKGTSPLATVELDDGFDQVPFECRPVVSQDLFGSFAARVRKSLTQQVKSPVVESLWRGIEGLDSFPWLGQRVAAARHRLEGAWGLNTLELPLSRVCRTDAFGWFFAQLVNQAQRLREIYNDSLESYRRIHKIRSKSHPVPRLLEEDGWIETPFWIYRASQPHRERLFVRHKGQVVEFSDLAGWSAQCSVDSVERWYLETGMGSVMIRPRALVTTWFSRLLLGQLFLHGIGGAKYDQLTDEIMSRFWGIDPPGFLTLTATFRMGIERPDVQASDLTSVRQKLRELRFHPEQHLSREQSGFAEFAKWAEVKRRAIREGESANLRERHRLIEESNLAMQSGVAAKRELLEEEERQLRQWVRLSQQLGSREFSFCLFSEAELREPLQRLATCD